MLKGRQHSLCLAESITGCRSAKAAAVHQDIMSIVDQRMLYTCSQQACRCGHLQYIAGSAAGLLLKPEAQQKGKLRLHHQLCHKPLLALLTPVQSPGQTPPEQLQPPLTPLIWTLCQVATPRLLLPLPHPLLLPHKAPTLSTSASCNRGTGTGSIFTRTR